MENNERCKVGEIFNYNIYLLTEKHVTPKYSNIVLIYGNTKIVPRSDVIQTSPSIFGIKFCKL